MPRRKKTKKAVIIPPAPKILEEEDTPITTIEDNAIVVYDTNQDSESMLLAIKNIVVTTFSFNVIVKLIYYYVIQLETEYLMSDIDRIRKRFNSNIYTRIVNEFNLFVVNSIDINSVDDINKCLLFGLSQSYYYDPNPHNILSDLMEKTSTYDTYINIDFFIQIYVHYIKQYVGLGPSLDTLKDFIPEETLNYDRYEKNNLRGAHSRLSDLRIAYEDKMKNYVAFNLTSSTYDVDFSTALDQFTTKLTDLIYNPDQLLCNPIISQNKINIRNFKDNFLSVNQMTIKDLYSNILDTTDGIVSTRIQNSIVKSIYIVVFIVGATIGYNIYRTLKYYTRKILLYRGTQLK
jgi:hypothetical protein